MGIIAMLTGALTHIHSQRSLRERSSQLRFLFDHHLHLKESTEAQATFAGNLLWSEFVTTVIV